MEANPPKEPVETPTPDAAPVVDKAEKPKRERKPRPEKKQQDKDKDGAEKVPREKKDNAPKYRKKGEAPAEAVEGENAVETPG